MVAVPCIYDLIDLFTNHYICDPWIWNYINIFSIPW